LHYVIKYKYSASLRIQYWFDPKHGSSAVKVNEMRHQHVSWTSQLDKISQKPHPSALLTSTAHYYFIVTEMAYIYRLF